jgi:hypothetical protein
MIAVVCPHCAAEVNAPDVAVGQSALCSQCQEPLQAPIATADEPIGTVQQPLMCELEAHADDAEQEAGEVVLTGWQIVQLLGIAFTIAVVLMLAACILLANVARTGGRG